MWYNSIDRDLLTYLGERHLDHHRGFRILLVDDEQDNLYLLRSFLESDYQILTATSGEEGLKVLEQHGVDLMIVDQRMPGMDGLTFCEQASELCPNSIRIMLTAYSDRDMLLAAMAGGKVFRVMTKPWNIVEVQVAVEEAFTRLAYQRGFLTLIEELQQKNEELERSYEQLQQAQAEKLRTQRMATLGSVTARIAHEMNNQLTVLVMLKSLREELRSQPQVGDSIDFIIEATENLYEMVHSLRVFTRGGEPELQRAPTDLASLVAHAVRFTAQSPLAEGVEFVESYEETPLCWLDPQRIKQVVLNLVRNALQALTDDRRVWLTLTRPTGSSVALAVTDRGEGIPQELQERVFEPFFTTKSHQGLGLGLEVCKQVVEKHGGTLTMESQEGVGTTFTLRLPITEDL